MEGPWHSEEVKVEATETDGPHRGPPRATTSTSTIEVEGVAEDLEMGGSKSEAGGLVDPKDPRISMFASCNRALPLSCLAVGVAMTFPGTPLMWYAIKELDVDPDRMSVLGTLVTLPTSLKVFFGLLTDCVPIYGLRRKPYIIAGWLLFVAANLALAIMGRPTINHLAGLSFLMVFGYILAEVACEAIIVERSVLEPPGRMGQMQGTGYIFRNLGNIVGAVAGLVVYNKGEWGWGLTISQIFFINGLLPLALVLPWLYQLHDERQEEGRGRRSLAKQFGDLWAMAQRRTVWMPMLFVAFYNTMQVPNAAWSNFLVLGLEFTPWQMGVLVIASTIFSWAGITVYQLFLTQCSWRRIYIITTYLSAFFSGIQLLLIFRYNVRWGISDLAFSIGDDVISSFNAAIQFLPTIIMYTRLCPQGAEGTSYALLVTFFNAALTVSQNVGTLMTRIWDVSNKALYHGDYDGLWKLTVLTSLLQPIGLALVWLLPRNAEQQVALQKSDSRSLFGGIFFLSFFAAALLWTFVQSAMVLSPG